MKNSKYNYISKDGKIELCEIDGTVYLRLDKHKPIVLHAEDKYRKGIEVDICDCCERLKTITVYDTDTNKKYCCECFEKGLFKKEECKYGRRKRNNRRTK